MKFTLTAMNYYPVKSCAGIALDLAEVGPRGIKHDREWMIVDAQGRFISQRENHSLCLVKVEVKSDGALLLSAPAKQSILVPKDKIELETDVVVWDDTCRGLDQGDEVAAWLSDYLKRECRLVRMKDGFLRPVEKDPFGNSAVGFADGFPFLLISEASLADLNAKLEYPILMNRFRPSLVVSGTEPFAEDSWKRIAINGVHFEIVKPCARCVITTVDQECGEAGKEPLRTLAAYRKFDGKIMFGQNLIHAGAGTLRVGAAVSVLA
ncbi:MAG: MOSC domain-containing protein [Candidatus Obscuribacterales bacterium]|nr:MOSC domain-containing protein [Candidatus Obscuribacterales bacterium]